MKGEVLFLGTGGSMGIPVVGCTCPVCTSSDPRNNRLRPSVLLTVNKKNYVIDVGPDFRYQALKFGITRLDGALLTHTHYDHIAGLDDLRVFYFKQKKSVPCLLSFETLEEIKIRYHYFLPPHERDAIHGPKLNFHVLDDHFGRTDFEHLRIEYLTYEQANMKVSGFRLNEFAYVTDVLDFTDEVYGVLEGVKTLVMSGMRWDRSVAHLGIPEVIEFAKRVGAKDTYLTHVSHHLEHEETSARLPKGIHMAYDGQKIECNFDVVK